MAFNWNYNPNNVSEFEIVEDGTYKVRITEVDDNAKSRNGNDMAVITLAVVGHNCTVKYYLVAFDGDKSTITDGNLKRIYESFPRIIKGSMPSKAWVGKVGTADIIIDEYVGSDGTKKKSNKVSRFVKTDAEEPASTVEIDDLPF